MLNLIGRDKELFTKDVEQKNQSIIKPFPGNRPQFFVEKISMSVKNIEKWIPL